MLASHLQGAPLEGVVIIDLTRVLAGPFCTLLLADLGATVIKVERPEVGDDARSIGPFVEGHSAYFASVNRGKRSIALDLKAEADRETFEALLDRADVLVENFRPGTLDRLGYDWSLLHDRWPQLICASTSGFGQTGPRANQAAYDMVVQAMGGIMSVTGHPGGPPTRVGTSVGDITAGLFTAVAINGALYHRAQTGEGSRIDVAMLDCQLAILENALARYFATGRSPGPIGARHPSITPFGAFRASDGHLVIAAGNDSLFQGLCQAIGWPGLAQDPRFVTNPDRTTHAEALQQAIESALGGHTVDHWLQVLEAAGVPCGPINTIERVLSDPQVQARNMVVTAIGEHGAPVQMAGNPIKWSACPDPAQRGAVPTLDGDREAILRWLES
ncbi:MAG: CaiB/BaiF CoA transferase family protein [Bradymonadia bacterium]